MREYLEVEISEFIPGRGRLAQFKRGLEPKMHEVISLNIDGSMVQKRVVGLECGSSSKYVMAVLRDPDFPDPVYWSDKKPEEPDEETAEALMRENKVLRQKLDRAIKALRNLGSNMWRDL